MTQNSPPKSFRVVSEPVTKETAESVLEAIDEDSLLRVEAFAIEEVSEA